MKKLHHLCIQTDDYEASLNFYCRVFDFKLIKETKNFHGRAYNSWLSSDDLMIELQTSKEGQVLETYTGRNKGLVHFCYYVDDLNFEYEKMISLGYTTFKRKNGDAIYVVEGGKLLKVIAPEGTVIELRDSQIL